ncbi:MAG: V-type ATP synthase subunit D, partial [Rectinema sp.]
MSIPLPAPTKSNLLKEKRNLELALLGYDLLEKKREILVMELMRRVDEIDRLERGLDARIATAYPALRRMLLSVGRERALSLAAGPARKLSLREASVSAAGFEFPSLEVEAGKPELGHSFMNSFAVCDETVLEFTELLRLLAVMAASRSIVWRLAREVKKTQRRVNALDKMVIPRSREVKRYIESSLEERDRESLFA